MKRKSERSTNFRTHCSAIRRAESGTLTPSETSTTSTGIGTASRPSSTTTRVAEGYGDLSTSRSMCSPKKFSSMNSENTPLTNSGLKTKHLGPYIVGSLSVAQPPTGSSSRFNLVGHA